MRRGEGPAQTLWGYIARKEAVATDASNGVGPFPEPGSVIRRHLRCPNYDACLGLAASRRWPSFHCHGCRRTIGGSFTSPPETPAGGRSL